MYLQIFTLLVTSLAALCAPQGRLTVTQATYDDLDNFMKYASSAYSASCPKPLGNTLVTVFEDLATSTEGYLARDDVNKLLIAAFRGSLQIQDFIFTDANIVLVPYVSPGVSAPDGAQIHAGFLKSYNAVASSVISAVRSQLEGPAAGYELRTTGQSLGGALSSLAAVSLKSNFPNTTIQMYTYGQPRTGNPIYANFVNGLFGADAFRAVHTFDGVPTMIPQFLGYRHHGIEYWQNPDPPSPNTVIVCDAGGEDPACSDSIPSTGINLAHAIYFGRSVYAAFCT